MLKNDIDELDIGDWCFLANKDENYIAIRLGPKDRDFCILPINIPRKTSWDWNGSLEAPTLKPSVLHWGNGRDKPATWHGFLRDGKLVEA